jgi:hypothetical protein
VFFIVIFNLVFPWVFKLSPRAYAKILRIEVAYSLKQKLDVK